MLGTGHLWQRAAFLVVLAAVPCVGIAKGQAPHARVLHVPATAEGFVGGESHDTHAVAARPGLPIAVRLAWKSEDGNTAEFTVTGTRDFLTAQPLDAGTWSQDQRQWSGAVPANGRLYVHVVAHPAAHYTLTIRSALEPLRH